ncbi:MAG: hypothetical protein HY326_13570 [Chloroflexi bacterium]|nr:hypothetical protein [Chloroflexota bacterium]
MKSYASSPSLAECSRCGYPREAIRSLNVPCAVCGALPGTGSRLPIHRLEGGWRLPAILGGLIGGVIGNVKIIVLVYCCLMLGIIWRMDLRPNRVLAANQENAVQVLGDYPRETRVVDEVSHPLTSQSAEAAVSPKEPGKNVAVSSASAATEYNAAEPAQSPASAVPLPGLGLARSSVQHSLEDYGFKFDKEQVIADKVLYPEQLIGQPVLWGNTRDENPNYARTWVYLIGPADKLLRGEVFATIPAQAEETVVNSQVQSMVAFLSAITGPWPEAPAWLSGNISQVLGGQSKYARWQTAHGDLQVTLLVFRDIAASEDFPAHTLVFLEVSPD